MLNISEIIGIIGTLIAVIALMLYIYLERSKGGFGGLKIKTSLGVEIGQHKKDKLYRPFWLCAWGIPKFTGEYVILQIPLSIKNDSNIPLNKIEINIYYSNRYSIAHSKNKELSNVYSELKQTDGKFNRMTGDYFNETVKASFFCDHISPKSFLCVFEPILISKIDLENGFSMQEKAFFNNEKVIQFKFHVQIFSENYKPIFFDTELIFLYSKTIDDTNKYLAKPMAEMLSQKTYNPFKNIKPGIYFHSRLLLYIFKKRFSKFSYMFSQIVTGKLRDKKIPTFAFEAIEETIRGYGNMTFLLPNTQSILVSFIKKIFKRKRKSSIT